MPWEGPLQRILSSLQGPVARILGVVSIVLVGLGLAFSEGGSTMRKAVFVVIGLAVVFNAALLVATLFNAGSGAVL
jgi:type IV secretion system protein VirB2